MANEDKDLKNTKPTPEEIALATKTMKDIREHLLPDEETEEKYTNWCLGIFSRLKRKERT